MGEEIVRHFFAMFAAEYNREFTYDAFQAVNAERNKLKDYLIGRGEEKAVRALLSDVADAPNANRRPAGIQ